MVRRFNAHVRNGVIVPDEKMELPEGRPVFVSFDEVANGLDDAIPLDPAAKAEWWNRHRLHVDPEIVRDILENPEFDIENS